MNKIHFENSENPFSSKIKISNLYLNPFINQLFSVLVNSIGQKDFLILVLGESQSGKTTLLSKLITQIQDSVKPCKLNINRKDKSPKSARNQLSAFLYKTEESQVIILDDAHQLSGQELSIIFQNAWDSNKKTSQLILFCEPGINSILSPLLKKMPKKTSVNKIYLKELTEKQTRDYLNHYLKISNLQDQYAFSKVSIKNIYVNSKGLPGKINHEAADIFSETKITPPDRKKLKLLVGITISCAIIAVVIYVITGVNPNKNIPELVTYPETIIKKIVSVDKPIKVTDPKLAGSTAQPGIIKPVIVNEKVEKKTIKTNNNQIIFQEQWILDQEPQLFTIQVMAATDDDSINRFVKLNKNNDNSIAYYKMHFKKDIWYKFITGKYKTFEKAKQASLGLPENLLKLGPWPRKFASIQSDINTFIKTSKPNQ